MEWVKVGVGAMQISRERYFVGQLILSIARRLEFLHYLSDTPYGASAG